MVGENGLRGNRFEAEILFWKQILSVFVFGINKKKQLYFLMFPKGVSLKSSDYYVARAREPYPDPCSYGMGQ